MDPSTAIQHPNTNDVFRWSTSIAIDRKTHIPALDVNNSTQEHHTQRASQSSTSPNCTTAIPNPSTGRHYTELVSNKSIEYGRSVPELRLAKRYAGLDGKNRPRHRLKSTHGRIKDQEEQLDLLLMESKGTIKDELVTAETGSIVIDWKEDDEESERPCYWTLLEKLNRELRRCEV